MSPKLEHLYLTYGAVIAADNMGRHTIMARWSLTEKEARNLAQKVKRDGPPVTKAAPAAQARPPRPSRAKKHDDCPDVLVIPDAHAEHGQNLWRFRALGKAIRELQPKMVVCIGDWTSHEALSKHDRGTLKGEGKRHIQDLKAGGSALELCHEEMAKGQGWNGRLEITLGNHDVYTERLMNEHPILDGAIGTTSTLFEEYGWGVHRFIQDILTVDGVSYAHYFPKPGSPHPIGGVNAGRALIMELHDTCIAGHSHAYHYYQTTTVAGRRIHGLVVGCFTDYRADYAGAVSSDRWWRGLITLHGVKDGDFSHRDWPLDQVKKRWG